MVFIVWVHYFLCSLPNMFCSSLSYAFSSNLSSDDGLIHCHLPSEHFCVFVNYSNLFLNTITYAKYYLINLNQIFVFYQKFILKKILKQTCKNRIQKNHSTIRLMEIMRHLPGTSRWVRLREQRKEKRRMLIADPNSRLVMKHQRWVLMSIIEVSVRSNSIHLRQDTRRMLDQAWILGQMVPRHSCLKVMKKSDKMLASTWLN